MVKRLCALIVLFSLTAAPSAAHVRVFPDAGNTQTPACGYAKFVVRVPVERNVATTRIDVAIPKGIVVYGVQPKPGWQYAMQRTKGSISSITWTGRLMPGEFDEFAFLAATPKTAGQISWNALQYYENGEIVRWTGSPNSETPHSITTVLPANCPNAKRSR